MVVIMTWLWTIYSTFSNAVFINVDREIFLLSMSKIWYIQNSKCESVTGLARLQD